MCRYIYIYIYITQTVLALRVPGGFSKGPVSAHMGLPALDWLLFVSVFTVLCASHVALVQAKRSVALVFAVKLNDFC